MPATENLHNSVISWTAELCRQELSFLKPTQIQESDRATRFTDDSPSEFDIDKVQRATPLSMYRNPNMLVDQLDLRLSVLAAALFLLLSASAPALAGDAVKGNATFISICSSCHGMDGIATLDYAPSFATLGNPSQRPRNS
jgi:mono/diheme cytochrome c family protein